MKNTQQHIWYHGEPLTPVEMDRLSRGERVVVAGAIYMMCHECRTVVKMNKFLIGSIHLCEPEPRK